jgi:AraC-like DNA-binding protein
MSASMTGLGWATKDGCTRWLAKSDSWVGAYESWRKRQGIYVSGKGSMLAFVLEGRVRARMGRTGHCLELTGGDALVIGARTPFAFDMDHGRMLIAEVDRDENALGLRHIPSSNLPKNVIEWGKNCWDRPDELLRATRMANASADARGVWHPFPEIHNTLRMLAIKDHLDSFFTQPLRLEDVARRFKLDPFYLSRGFSQTTGVSPKAFVQALRLEHFLRATLERNDRSLTRLALEAGVPDYSAFCRWIKQRLGLSPSELSFPVPNDQVFPSPLPAPPLTSGHDDFPPASGAVCAAAPRVWQ